MKRKTRGLFLATLAVALVLAFAAAALASNGNPSATVPSSGDVYTGDAAAMYGSPVRGQMVFNNNCAACHGNAGHPTDAFPGLNDVQNPNPSYSIDPELYDPNPAFFARNIDPFIQHGSDPGGVPAPMPAFGDSGTLSQVQIADAEAYVMSLSHVKWPSLSLSGGSASGAGFVPGSLVQLYRNSMPMGTPVGIDAAGNLASTAVYGTSGDVTAHYAELDEYGVYPNGDSTQGDLALDGNRGTGATVASTASRPGLTLSQTRAYWNTLSDYQNRRLSVDFSIANTGNSSASDVYVVGSHDTGGVTTATALPVSLGSIAPSGSADLTLKYSVPDRVTAFLTFTFAVGTNGGNVFSYPADYPGV